MGVLRDFKGRSAGMWIQFRMDLQKQTVINPLTTMLSWTMQAIFSQLNTAARSLKNRYNGKATRRFLCTAERHVTVNNIKISSVAQTILLRRIYVAGKNNSYSGPRLKVLDIFSTDFQKSPQYQLARKYRPVAAFGWYMRTDRQIWGIQQALFFCKYAKASKTPLNRLG
jgi:hypothetical protein